MRTKEADARRPPPLVGPNPARGRGEASAAAVIGARRGYRRSPIFWGMMLSAPIVWALAFFVVARIFRAALR